MERELHPRGAASGLPGSHHLPRRGAAAGLFHCQLQHPVHGTCQKPIRGDQRFLGEFAQNSVLFVLFRWAQTTHACVLADCIDIDTVSIDPLFVLRFHYCRQNII